MGSGGLLSARNGAGALPLFPRPRPPTRRVLQRLQLLHQLAALALQLVALHLQVAQPLIVLLAQHRVLTHALHGRHLGVHLVLQPRQLARQPRHVHAAGRGGRAE